MSARRRRPAPSRAKKRGHAPGAAIYLGLPREHSVDVSVFTYDPAGYEERHSVSLTALRELRDCGRVSWVNLNGVHDVEAVRHVCETFGVHPVALEDILNPGAHAKVEHYGDLIFVVVKMLTVDDTPDEFEHEQISLVLGPRWVLTFQEREGDTFDAIRRRIRNGIGRIRSSGSDYLLHAVLDAVVDGYFAGLESLDDSIARLEDQAMDEHNAGTAVHIHEYKGRLLGLRRLVWPLRDAATELIRSEGTLVTTASMPFYRDLNDHIHQVIDAVDAYRDRLTAVLELHLAITSNRMNEIMRVLTIVATLFIPLTFVTGLYGMNFQYMPELAKPWGYPAVLTLMGVMVVGMVVWLRRQRWL
jgi:magnesium transporter